MSNSFSLEDRMKEFYEKRSRTALTRKTPVIIRIDGKAFHSFTKGFQKPYDEVFHKAMNNTMLRLCENIQGCKFGFTQSDEISLLLTDFDKLTTDAWFDYEVQKICSIAASMATLYFNQSFRTYVNEYTCGREMDDYAIKLMLARDKGALFDARAFSLPIHEVNNYFIWRQGDGTRNAIQMLSRTYFSDKEIYKLNTDAQQEKLFTEKGINFNDMPVAFKRGVCCLKVWRSAGGDPEVVRRVWQISEPPIFKEDSTYISDTYTQSSY